MTDRGCVNSLTTHISLRFISSPIQYSITTPFDESKQREFAWKLGKLNGQQKGSVQEENQFSGVYSIRFKGYYMYELT